MSEVERKAKEWAEHCLSTTVELTAFMVGAVVSISNLPPLLAVAQLASFVNSLKQL
jgi:hypothetical protein